MSNTEHVACYVILENLFRFEFILLSSVTTTLFGVELSFVQFVYSENLEANEFNYQHGRISKVLR